MSYFNLKRVNSPQLAAKSPAEAVQASAKENTSQLAARKFILSDEQFEELKILKKEISQLESEFQKNINDDNSFITVSDNELLGCSERFIEYLKQDDAENYVLTCDYFTIYEILNHCRVESTRKKLWIMFNNRAYPTNKIVLEQLIKKRKKLAHRLGFSSYTAFDLDDQMIETEDHAKKFLEDLHKKLSLKVDLEFARLCNDLPEGVSLEDGKFNHWDLNYASTHYKKKHFKLDEREIAQYFPLESTIDGLFRLYQKFLGLEFKKVNPEGLWDDDVFAVEIYKTGDSRPLAYVFFDVYSRANKFPSACASKVVSASKMHRPSVYFLITNFSKPSKTTPSLLGHNEVVELFHEFGHVMHAVLGQTEMAGFSGTSVKRDFVEVPSLLFEQWAWDGEILQMISSHYETGKPLPKHLIDMLVELKSFDRGNSIQQQCVLSLLSLDLFSQGGQKDLDGILMSYNRYFPHIRYEPEEHFYASWIHIAQSRYGAKYYSYLWSSILAHDVFASVKEYGVLNDEIGKKLINAILGQGGSKDPNILLTNFLGREPNSEAFIDDVGAR
jgi:thimet oligopeptidase